MDDTVAGKIVPHSLPDRTVVPINANLQIAAMQKAKPLSSAQTVRSSRRHSHWLSTAEFAAAIGSGVGLVVSVLTEQAIAAAFPLTLAVSLNLVNRQRFQRQLQHEHRAAIAQVYEIIKSLPDPNNVNALTDRLFRIEQSNQAMTAQIEALKQQVRVKFKPEQLDVLKEAIALLRADLTEIQQQALQRHELERQLQHQLEQLYERSQSVSPLRQPEDARRIEQAIAILHRDLTTLKAQVTPLGSADWQSVRQRVDRLQAHLQAVEGAIVPLRRKQNAMTNKLLPRMVKLINDLRQPTHTAPVQKTIIHRPPPPPLIHHHQAMRLSASAPTRSTGAAQPFPQQQVQRDRL